MAYEAFICFYFYHEDCNCVISVHILFTLVRSDEFCDGFPQNCSTKLAFSREKGW
jgi:hypothetical protein